MIEPAANEETYAQRHQAANALLETGKAALEVGQLKLPPSSWHRRPTAAAHGSNRRLIVVCCLGRLNRSAGELVTAATSW